MPGSDFAAAVGGTPDTSLAGVILTDPAPSGDSNASAAGAVFAEVAAVLARVSAGKGMATVLLLLISARAGIDTLYTCDRDGRSSETPASRPAVAPIAAATTAMRRVRLKLGIGAK